MKGKNERGGKKGKEERKKGKGGKERGKKEKEKNKKFHSRARTRDLPLYNQLPTVTT